MAVSKTVSPASVENSVAYTVGSNTVAAWIQMKCVHSGTPSPGDTVTFKLLESTGDIDTDPDTGGSDYSDPVNSLSLLTFDLNVQEPAISKLISIPLSLSFRLRVENDGASNVTVYSQIIELAVTGSRSVSQVEF